MPVTGERYWRDDNGLWVENVGPWAREKLKVVTDYVQIASKTRKKYAHCTFLDVFCGPGRSQIRDTRELVYGSPVAVFKQAQRSHPFSEIYISDADDELLASAEARLLALKAPVHAVKGPASAALPSIVDRLSPSGLHLVLLDPHNLGTLSFDLFECLARRLRRVDIIVHVSLGDLQRNTDLYTSDDQSQFDRFAPGWRNQVPIDSNTVTFRAALLDYWTEKVAALGLPRAKHCELIRGTKNQRLYWLMLLAGHELPHSFWEKISSLAKAPQFRF
jgi:three-Cys-motif partner protein